MIRTIRLLGRQDEYRYQSKWDWWCDHSSFCFSTMIVTKVLLFLLGSHKCTSLIGIAICSHLILFLPKTILSKSTHSAIMPSLLTGNGKLQYLEESYWNIFKFSSNYVWFFNTHRKFHKILCFHLGFGVDEEVLLLAEDNLALQTYAQGFWRPLPPRNKAEKYRGTFYHIQSGVRFKSPLLDKNSTVVEKMLGSYAEKSDFMSVSQFCNSLK